MRLFVVAFVASISYCAAPVSAVELSGNIAVEYRGFAHAPLDTQQAQSNFSLSAEPELYHSWDKGKQSLTFVPFVRLDENDAERSHADIRELTWLKASDDWELRLGIRKLFWGVTESQHLVDIINQTDLVERPDGEDKLGQPMLNLALINDWGTVDLFLLPYFRERTFPGINGRLRSQPRVDSDQALYESSDKEKHLDYAVRWAHTLDVWDIGLSHFYGTSRDPRFNLGTDSSGNAVFIPVYDLINQTGLDVQATLDNWLWKLELIRRTGQGHGFYAATGGFEYTFYGVFESPADIGLVMEYLYDDRGKTSPSPFNDDVMMGLRLTLNDEQNTEALLGVIADVDTDAMLYSIEASRRLGERWKLNIEGRLYQYLPASDPLYAYRDDDFIEVELAYYF